MAPSQRSDETGVASFEDYLSYTEIRQRTPCGIRSDSIVRLIRLHSKKLPSNFWLEIKTMKTSFLFPKSARNFLVGLLSFSAATICGIATEVPIESAEIRATAGDRLTVTGSGEVVMNLTDFVAGAGSKLTLRGQRGTKFVINVSGDFDINSAKIVLGGGVLPSDVVFNLTGTGVTLKRQIIGNSVFFGALNIVGSQVTVVGSMVNGRKIAGTAQFGVALATTTPRVKPPPKPRGPVSP